MQKTSVRFAVIALAFAALTALRLAADDIKIWPLLYQDTDPETRTARTEFMWPFFVRETTPRYSANQFLSFPQSFPPEYPHQFYMIWPVSGLRTGAGHDAWLFPFLWSGADRDRNDHYTALFPIFYYGENGSAKTLNLALLQHNHWDANGYSHYLFPFFWNKRSSTASCSGSSFGLLPLFWLSASQSSGRSYQSRSNSGGVMLLGWWHRGGSTNSTARGRCVSENASEGLFPIFHRSHNSSVYSAEASSRSSRDSLWLFPYWQCHETNRFDAVPFGTSRHRLFPLYWDWSDAKNHSVDSGRTLLPLWWRSALFERGELTESAEFLVPVGAHFYRKGEYDTRNVLGPIFNRTENERTQTVRYDALFPLFSLTRGSEESGGHIFPLAGWNVARGEHDNLWYAFPLGWNCESQESFDYRLSRPQLFALHEMETRPAVQDTDCRAGPRRTVAFYPFCWSRRQADTASQGLLPFYWRNTHRCGRDVSCDTALPLLLGGRTTTYRDDIPTYSHQGYLLWLIAQGRGESYREWRVFPFFSYERSGGSLDYSSFILPFSYESWSDPDRPDRSYSSELSVPFSFLPLWRTAASRSESSGSTHRSWIFPLYKHEKSTGPEGDRAKLSILWPLWNGEWMNEETRIRGLGGVVNYYERDAGGFVEQRLLYRVFSRRTRSWLSQHELMPLYAQSSREDGTSSWGFLGGLVGGGSDGERNYLRLLYIKFHTGAVAPVPASTLAGRLNRHAELALKYLKHDRHDRAAVEFTLAGDAYAGDAGFQLAAGEAYMKARPDALGKELRSSIPSSLDPIYGKSGTGNAGRIRQNLLKLAAARFEKALELGADRPATLRKLAAAMNDLGNRGEALRRLEESDKLSPGFATAMLRLETARMIWRESRDRARQTAMAALHALLAELNGRYPQSPTLAIEEAGLVQLESDPQRYPFGCFDSNVWLPDTDLFSKSTLRQLELYQQGAQWMPGAEEQAWLASKSQPSGRTGMDWCMAANHAQPIPPSTQCARLAASILNRQMRELISKKSYHDAQARCPAVTHLLPRACIRCASDANSRDQAGYDDPTATFLQNLYAIHVTAFDHPLDFIAAAEGLASTLCKHRQPVVERALEPVRLEQQYIKTWHIAGALAGLPASRDYSGKFFERYVDLDSLLGRPDHCTVTAECVVTSPGERRAVLRLGFDHTLAAELNGSVIFAPKSRKIAMRDEFRIPVTLKAGENRLKLTVSDDTLAYGFFARLSSESGEFMRDLAITARAAEK